MDIHGSEGARMAERKGKKKGGGGGGGGAGRLSTAGCKLRLGHALHCVLLQC